MRLSYNGHPLRTEHGQSPEQMYVRGMLQQATNPSTGVARFFERSTSQNNVSVASDTAPVPQLQLLNSSVEVDQCRCPLSAEQRSQLEQRINPVLHSQDGNDSDVYGEVLRFMATCEL